jgi:hypothetical protein
MKFCDLNYCLIVSDNTDVIAWGGPVIWDDGETALAANTSPILDAKNIDRFILIERRHRDKVAFFSSKERFRAVIGGLKLSGYQVPCYDHRNIAMDVTVPFEGPYMTDAEISTLRHFAPSDIDLYSGDQWPFSWPDLLHDCLKRRRTMINGLLEIICKGDSARREELVERQSLVGRQFSNVNDESHVIGTVEVVKYQPDEDRYLCISSFDGNYGPITGPVYWANGANFRHDTLSTS